VGWLTGSLNRLGRLWCSEYLRAGASRGKTHPELRSEFGMSRCHEGRHFFVAHLDEIDVLPVPISALQGAQHAEMPSPE
jgi:hypothetical protein